MPVPFNEAMYPRVKQWLVENPQDRSLSEPIKESLFRFETLTEREKEQLRTKLLAIRDLPEVLQQFMTNRLDTLPVELLIMVGEYLTPQERRGLAATEKRMNFVFRQHNLRNQFLECVAYGQQDKAEKLLSELFQEESEAIQAALLHQGTFTTYAGETFNCSAYEYAYWAKDTHMCRMLEQYMDHKTKAKMLTRIDAIEAHGLTFKQNDKEHCSAHFDFTPLKKAYQHYLSGHAAWLAANNLDDMNAAWLNVGKAQRNVPAHVAQECCRTDRLLRPTLEFNEATLPRKFTVYNHNTGDYGSWFPLTASNSGLGFDFALLSGKKLMMVVDGGRGAGCEGGGGLSDLAAITRLDEVRTIDLKQSRENLNPPAMSQSMTV